ncbi:MAG: PAS domain S-box protein [Erysipelothrix sp.]|nr:PAS domain S-box protein [Erysipelothrix sp.]
MKKSYITLWFILLCAFASLSRVNAVQLTFDFYETFEQHGSIMLIIDSENGLIVYANAAAEKFYGYSKVELQSMKISQINTLTIEEIEAEIAKATHEERNYFEFNHRLADGSVRNVEVYSYPYTFDEKTVLLSIINDVTNHKVLQRFSQNLLVLLIIIFIFASVFVTFLISRLLKSIKQIKNEKQEVFNSKAELNSVIDNIQGVVYRRKNDQFWTMEYISKGVFDLTGFLPDVFIDNKDLSFTQLILPEFEVDFTDSSEVYEREYKIKDIKGTQKWILDRGKIKFDEQGNPIVFEGIMSDISNIRHLESQLITYKNQLELIANNLSEVIYLTDVNHNIIFINQAFEILWNISIVEIYKNSNLLFEQVNLLDCQNVEIAFEKYKKTGVFKKVCRLKSIKNDIWINWKINPIENENGLIIGHVGSMVNITEAKNIEIALEKANEKMAKVVNNDVLGVMFWKTDIGLLVDANDSMLGMIGYTREDIQNELITWKALTPDEYIDLSLSEMSIFAETGKIGPYEKEYINKDGSRKWFLFTGALIEENYAVEFCVDITDKKISEKLINETQSLSNVGNYIIDVTNNKSYCSDVLKKIFGLMENNISYIEYRDRWIHPDDKDQILTSYEDAIKNRSGFNCEYRIVSEVDDEIQWINEIIDTEYDKAGNLIRLTGLVMDITQRKQQNEELEKQKENLSSLTMFSNLMRTARNSDEIYTVLMNEVAKLFHTSHSAISVLSKDQLHFTFTAATGHFLNSIGNSYSISEGMSGRVYRTKETVITKDYRQEKDRLNTLSNSNDLGPMILIPLKSENNVIGVLIIAHSFSSKYKEFSPFEFETIKTMGEIAGSALHRSLLFEETRDRLNHIQTLHNIDIAITNGDDIKDIFSIVLIEINKAADYKAASIILTDRENAVLRIEHSYGFGKEVNGMTLQPHHHKFFENIALKKNLYNIISLDSIPEYDIPKYFANENFKTYYAFPLISKDIVIGILELHFDVLTQLKPKDIDFIETITSQCAVAIVNAQLFNSLEMSNQNLLAAYDATIEGWAHALDLKDEETKDHSSRVTKLTIEMAKRMNIDQDEMINIQRGALLHDIGKIGIPDSILLNKGKLSDEEWVIMRKHPVYAYDMLSKIPYLVSAIDIPYYHHEKWDGSGYPFGLRETQIPLAARIFAVIDVYDALINDRPYRKAWSKQEALDYIIDQKGKHFDPEVVNEFIRMINNLT